MGHSDKIRLAFAILFAANAGAASAHPIDPVASSGHSQTRFGRELVKGAIASANAVLASSSEYRLAGSWEAVPRGREPTKILRVYLVAPAQPDFIIQVPYRSCNCVLMQPVAFQRHLENYSTKLSQMMKLEDRQMLAFMLLHEVGHVVQTDAGSTDGAIADHGTKQKRRERAADEFAARALIAAGQAKSEPMSFLAAMRIQMAVTSASWNLAALRLLDGFGGSVLCSKALFGDVKSSHPNFELRILTVNDIVASSDASRELLAAFEACREDPASNRP